MSRCTLLITIVLMVNNIEASESFQSQCGLALSPVVIQSKPQDLMGIDPLFRLIDTRVSEKTISILNWSPETEDANDDKVEITIARVVRGICGHAWHNATQHGHLWEFDSTVPREERPDVPVVFSWRESVNGLHIQISNNRFYKFPQSLEKKFIAGSSLLPEISDNERMGYTGQGGAHKIMIALLNGLEIESSSIQPTIEWVGSEGQMVHFQLFLPSALLKHYN